MHHYGHMTATRGKDKRIQPRKSRGAWQQHLPPCSGAASTEGTSAHVLLPLRPHTGLEMAACGGVKWPHTGGEVAKAQRQVPGKTCDTDVHHKRLFSCRSCAWFAAQL